MWIDELFDDNVKTQEVIYPFTPQALNDVLRGLKETLHGNFIASFLAVGRFITFITKFSTLIIIIIIIIIISCLHLKLLVWSHFPLKTLNNLIIYHAITCQRPTTVHAPTPQNT